MADTPDPNLVALGLTWGGDLVLTSNGSLQFVSGLERLRERIIRRYFTGPAVRLADGTFVPPDYIFDPNYGFGAIRMIGEPASDETAAKLIPKIRSSVLIDEGVDTTRSPEIKLFHDNRGAIWANVGVYLLDVQQIIYINFVAARAA